ncbi:MAG: transcriptional regulator, partial [Gammaproteobacteria bacterium]|nr:transcriptional regulator [Gammaproteobacteria bacterium]
MSPSTTTALIRLMTLALAAAFLLMLLRPEIFIRSGPVVEIQQSPTLPVQSGPASYADAVSRAAPAVVNINTAKVVMEQSATLF